MDLLLDTHAFIWWNAQASRLATAARDAIRDPANRIAVRIEQFVLASQDRQLLPYGAPLIGVI